MDKINFPKLPDEDIRNSTGKTWEEWCHLLDRWDGQTKSLFTLSSYLLENHHVRRLWAQMIAVYYKWEWCSRGRQS